MPDTGSTSPRLLFQQAEGLAPSSPAGTEAGPEGSHAEGGLLGPGSQSWELHHVFCEPYSGLCLPSVAWGEAPTRLRGFQGPRKRGTVSLATDTQTEARRGLARSLCPSEVGRSPNWPTPC